MVGNPLGRIFTLHFATINTIPFWLATISAILFTLHFATINTNDTNSVKSPTKTFTLHFATINTPFFLLFLHLPN